MKKKIEPRPAHHQSRRRFVGTLTAFGAAAGAPALLGACSTNRPVTSAEPADVVYIHGKVVTLDGTAPGNAGTIASAVAVRDGLIARVGSDADVLALRGSRTRVVDLGGKTVVPGFVDAHSHPLETAMMSASWVDCRYPGCRTAVESVGRIQQFIKARNVPAWTDRSKAPEHAMWVMAAGVSATQNKFTDGLPTKAQLDTAAPNNPMAFANGAHLAIVNSAALQALKVGNGPPNSEVKLPHGGAAQLGADGKPTGTISDGMADLPTAPTADETVQYYSETIQQLWNRWGFTSLMAITPYEAVAAMQAVAATRKTPPTLRMFVSVWSAANGSDLTAEMVRKATMPAGVDRNWCRIGALKLWIDGENDARTGLMREPYLGSFPTDPPGNRGSQVTSDAQAMHLARLSVDAGLVPMLHVAGDKAMDIGLDTYDRLLATGAKPPLIRLEHYGVFQMYADHVQRARAMYARGLRFSVQPTWLLELVKADYENMGAARTESGFAFRTMIDAGLEPAAGTDVTGIYLDNLNPFLGIHAAVNRASDWSDTQPFQPQQAINVIEALKMWTIWPARSMGDGAVKGTIEVGKFADMVVLSDDVLAMKPSGLQNVKVEKTIAGGEIVWPVRS